MVLYILDIILIDILGELFGYLIFIFSFYSYIFIFVVWVSYYNIIFIKKKIKHIMLIRKKKLVSQNEWKLPTVVFVSEAHI